MSHALQPQTRRAQDSTLSHLRHVPKHGYQALRAPGWIPWAIILAICTAILAIAGLGELGSRFGPLTYQGAPHPLQTGAVYAGSLVFAAIAWFVLQDRFKEMKHARKGTELKREAELSLWVYTTLIAGGYLGFLAAFNSIAIFELGWPLLAIAALLVYAAAFWSRWTNPDLTGMPSPQTAASSFSNLDTPSPPAITPEQTMAATEDKPAEDAELPALTEFGTDMIAAARAGQYPPIIGRDTEVEQVIDILLLRNKSNPVLLGHAGVGKTAGVEGLAQRMAAADVPEELLQRPLIELDLGKLEAGTRFRGDFEQRLERIVSEAEALHAILFCDELHRLISSGSSSDTAGAAQALKPALARGTFSVIGATTEDEYQHIIEDPALERRFQPVLFKEPSVEVAVEMLTHAQPGYEQRHGVSYADDAAPAAVRLATRYISDRYLPDKAFDLFDQAAVRAKRDGEYEVSAQTVAAVLSRKLGIDVPTPANEDELADNALAKIDSLIGLELFKTGARSERTYIAAEQIKARHRPGYGGAHLRRHTVLEGPPGTGKTLAAALLSELWTALGVSNGRFKNTSASKLLSEGTVGEGRAKVRALLARNEGGVVLIDEVGALTSAKHSAGDSGQEVVQELLDAMENDPACPTVILADYPKRVAAVLAMNDGFSSRIQTRFQFVAYQPEQLVQIAELEAGKDEHTFSPAASQDLGRVLHALYIKYAQHPNWSSGRVGRQVYERTKVAQAQALSARIASNPETDPFELVAEDVQASLSAYLGSNPFPVSADNEPSEASLSRTGS